MVESGYSNIVKTKRASYKIWQKSRKEEDFERYKYARKEIKKVIRDAKFKALMTFTIS